MKLIIQTIFFILAITMAISLIFGHSPTPKPINNNQSSKLSSHETQPLPMKRVSRFLQQKARNPNAADHCHKDKEVCNYIKENGRNTTCCNNKCIDLAYDDHNCGACKNKCSVTETCCGGECVDLAFDKSHCSFCNNKCMENGYCIYGICDYA